MITLFQLSLSYAINLIIMKQYSLFVSAVYKSISNEEKVSYYRHKINYTRKERLQAEIIFGRGIEECWKN